MQRLRYKKNGAVLDSQDFALPNGVAAKIRLAPQENTMFVLNSREETIIVSCFGIDERQLRKRAHEFLLHQGIKKKEHRKKPHVALKKDI